MDTNTTNTFERSTRYHLRKTGHLLRKSRKHGGYMIVGAETNSVVYGSGYDATLWDVYSWSTDARRDAGQRMNRYAR